MGATSLHFTDAELACKCCGVNECKPELLDALEELRTLIGRPITIDSAYRCPAHNKAVGGELHSQHMLGIAADIRVPGISMPALEHFIRQVPAFNGIGRDDSRGFVHADTRKNPAQWCYAPDGKVVPYYAPPAVQIT